jgi:hypothetical protein
MSIIKDLNELHIELKSALISIFFVMPFWFVALYLLDRQFIISNVFYIPLIFSFCLSICTLVPMHLITFNYFKNVLIQQMKNHLDITKLLMDEGKKKLQKGDTDEIKKRTEELVEMETRYNKLSENYELNKDIKNERNTASLYYATTVLSVILICIGTAGMYWGSKLNLTHINFHKNVTQFLIFIILIYFSSELVFIPFELRQMKKSYLRSVSKIKNQKS